MVSERSRLFEAHPDWAIGIPGRPRTESRQQLVLDMSRPEIVDHLFGVLSEVLSSAPISYVKWDMNRNITEPFSLALPADRQGEFFHRYILGVYDLYARLTTRLPGHPVRVLRGRRWPVRPGDAGLRAAGLDERRHGRRRTPEDPVGDLDGVPVELDGARTSRRCPNHQTGRITPIATRAAVAFFGVVRVRAGPDRARPPTTGARSPTRSRSTRPTASCSSAAGSSACAARSRRAATRRRGWSVAPDASRAVVGFYQVLNRPVPADDRLRLRGLDPARVYRVSGWPDDGDPLCATTRGCVAATS